MSESWSLDVYKVIKERGYSLAATVPDGGLTELLQFLEADSDIKVATLTTEEEGVALLCGAWLGGTNGVLLMQSSGVGNTINMFSLPRQCRIPVLALVTMRGGAGESNPWQIPMGQAVSDVLAAIGVRTYQARHQSEVGTVFEEAADYAFNSRNQAAVLIAQQVIGIKSFEGD